MINYFHYNYATPDTPPTGDAALHIDVTMIQTLRNAQTGLIRIAVQAKRPDVDQRPPP